MPAEILDHAADEAKSAKAAAAAMAEQSQRVLNEAAQAAEKTIAEAAKKAERVLKEGIEALRVHTRAYTDTAGQQADEAQRYVMERIKERPVTATLAGLGVGLLLGLLLSNRSK
jgi:ElaB/YqjD/DUF883 family membrane-anchored ribosome-binding protein